jgi:1-acyl-sn-glycerol-3-phosphate acyltransferase
MSDVFYYVVRCIGWPAFYLSSSPTVLHVERLNAVGPMIIAPNHLSPYDVPCLMASTRRTLDFVSMVELFRNPALSWFLGSMNAFPLDRGRRDSRATRKILERLERGRKVVMFPEGQIRTAGTSMLAGGAFKESVVRLARLANVPIVPCVILATGAFARPHAWLPFRRTRYAVNFCELLRIERSGNEGSDCAEATGRLTRAYEDGYAELRAASGLSVTDSPWRSREI